MINNSKKIMLFTGAGASAPLGFPTTAQLVEKIKENEEVSDIDLLNEVIEFLQIKNGVKVVDVENILWFIDSLNTEIKKGDIDFLFLRLSKDPGTPYFKTALSTRGDMRHAIKMLSEKLASPAEELDKLKNELELSVHKHYQFAGNATVEESFKLFYGFFLQRFGRHLKTQGLFPFFTTNYDLGVESIFQTLKFQQELKEYKLLNGFDDSLRQRDNYWREKNYKQIDNNKINILFYKLHGSLSYRQDGARVYQDIHETWSGNKNNHAIIYPGFKGEPKETIFRYPHDKLRNYLQDFQCCIVIGFSFRDEYINGIFKEAMRENKELQVIIVLPTTPAEESGTGIYDLMGKFKNRIIHIADEFGKKSALVRLKKELDS